MKDNGGGKQFIVGVGGFASNVGKTTLVCALLRELPGWEAIKITRGHYRSCGKDPHTCCVSDMLRAEPVIRSGRTETYAADKDTGHYWAAGAAQVHWVVVTDEQVEAGLHLALARVQTPGVIIEGTGFWQYVRPDVALLAARATGGTVKASARRVWNLADGIYLGAADDTERAAFRLWFTQQKALGGTLPPLYGAADIPQLAAQAVVSSQWSVVSKQSIPVHTDY